MIRGLRECKNKTGQEWAFGGCRCHLCWIPFVLEVLMKCFTDSDSEGSRSPQDPQSSVLWISNEWFVGSQSLWELLPWGWDWTVWSSKWMGRSRCFALAPWPWLNWIGSFIESIQRFNSHLGCGDVEINSHRKFLRANVHQYVFSGCFI